MTCKRIKTIIKFCEANDVLLANKYNTVKIDGGDIWVGKQYKYDQNKKFKSFKKFMKFINTLNKENQNE
jgi:hypothetical protein